MKINFLSCRVLILPVTAIVIFIGCVKSATTTPPIQSPTVAQLIKSATNLTLFNAALVRTGLDTTLNNPDSMVIVFVATDQIMSASGLGAAVIDTMNVSTLKNLIAYTIKPGYKTPSTQFDAGPNFRWQMASGDSVFETNTGSLIYINGIPVANTDVSASNGYLDVMSKPLFPPVDSILRVIAADTTLSFFDSAVLRTQASVNNIWALLTSGNIYTVFVPNNNAFRQAGYLTVDTVNVDTLAKFLSYHMIAGRYFTSDMSIALNNSNGADSITQMTLSGETIKIKLSSYFQAEGTSDSVAANIYLPNILARNGVIHKIDRTLLQ
jgi:uncharacterized surface protein with fasciclin (FAS1) repeats